MSVLVGVGMSGVGMSRMGVDMSEGGCAVCPGQRVCPAEVGISRG